MKSFMDFLLEDFMAEANKNLTLDFTNKDINAIFTTNEADISDVTNINTSSEIYKYLKSVVKNPEFYCLIISELAELQQTNYKLKGLMSTSTDEINRFTSSASDSKLNLICVDATNTQREEYIEEIIKYFSDKINSDKDYYLSNISKVHHELHFQPNKTNELCKKYKFGKIILHLVQPSNNRLLNKISSDITEFLPAIAMACVRDGNMKVVTALSKSNLTPEALVKLLTDNKKYILGAEVCDEESLDSLINGINSNISKDIIKQKVSHAVILVNVIHSYLIDIEAKSGKGVQIGTVKIDNQKQKDTNDAADIVAIINGKPLNLSVKDDKIDGTGHSLRDFSLLKRLDVIKDLRKIYDVVSFDKFVKTLPKEKIADDAVNKKDYYRWFTDNTDKYENAVKQHKDIFAKVLQYVLNMANPNTMILSHSGVHANITNNKKFASYALHYINDMEKGDNSVDISIKKSGNETQLITILKDDKPVIQITAQIGAGKYLPIKKDKLESALADDKAITHIVMVIKYKDVIFKNFKSV